MKTAYLIIIILSFWVLSAGCTRHNAPVSEPLPMDNLEENKPSGLTRPGLDSDKPLSQPAQEVTATLLPFAAVQTQVQAADIFSAPRDSTPLPSKESSSTLDMKVSSATAIAALHTAIPAYSASASASPIPSEIPTLTPSPMPAEIPTETIPPAFFPSLTPQPQPGVILGKVFLNGMPLDRSITLVLENQDYLAVQKLSFQKGEYRFDNLPASIEGYNILFSQENNPQFENGSVVSWAWIGPVSIRDGETREMPILDLSIQGLQPLSPSDGSIFKASSLQTTPLVFEWQGVPTASRYWVDLFIGSSFQSVWQSDFISQPYVRFNGSFQSGERLAPGSYWWSVGMQIDDLSLTVVSPVAGFTLLP
jgi:hypothetical protein